MTASLAPAGLDRLHAALAARVERHELPGVVTLLAKDEQVHVDAIGTTAFDSPEPLRRETPFRIASMTKPILSVATLQLLEDGRLRLDDPVERWLPELANRRVLRRVDGPLDDTVPAQRPITVDDLLTLRLGIGVLVDPSFDAFPIAQAAEALQLVLGRPDPPSPHTPDEWLRRFASLPLMAQPGERWLYNVGSLVLGVLLPRVAGQPLDALLRERIFEPLGMHHTGFWLPAELTQHLPSCYMANFASGQLERLDVARPEDWTRPPAFPSGAGGLLSTADDYLAFGRMLLNGGVHQGRRLLAERSVELMTSNHLTPEQLATAGVILNGRGWGFGVGVVTEPDAAWPVPGRYGWAGGYGTAWFNDPRHGLVAIAMTQVSDVLWNGTLAEFDQLASAV